MTPEQCVRTMSRACDVFEGQPIIAATNGTLASVIKSNGMLPNVHARFCTRILKLKPYGAFMQSIAPAVVQRVPRRITEPFKGRYRNRECLCGSGFKQKRCHPDAA